LFWQIKPEDMQAVKVPYSMNIDEYMWTSKSLRSYESSHHSELLLSARVCCLPILLARKFGILQTNEK